MTHTYAHPKYNDDTVHAAKQLYKQYVVQYVARTAIGRVATDMGITYSDAASMIATKRKVNMNLTEQVHACYAAMMAESKHKSRYFCIMDVCDRMHLDYDTVERLVGEEVLIQLTLF